MQISSMMFTETQHLSRQALRIVTWIMIGVTLFQVVLFTTLAVGLRDPEVFYPLGLTLAVLLGTTLMMRLATMDIRINAEMVHVKARFFHRRGRFIPWSDVVGVRLRPLRAFSEFGGWGIRYGFSNTWGYIYDGTTALELTLASNKKVVISVVDDAALRTVLQALDIAV